MLVNNEGGTNGTLCELLQLCQSPFGKRLFRHWLMSPLRDAKMINERSAHSTANVLSADLCSRLDAVDDLLKNQDFTGKFRSFAKSLPDLEVGLLRPSLRSCADPFVAIGLTDTCRLFASD